jgi:spore germination cell wall hydrolase CwlJ-like protein
MYNFTMVMEGFEPKKIREPVSDTKPEAQNYRGQLKKSILNFLAVESNDTPGLRDIPAHEFLDDAQKLIRSGKKLAGEAGDVISRTAFPAAMAAGIAFAPEAAHANPNSRIAAIDSRMQQQQGALEVRPQETFSEESLKCITDNVYHEARGEPMAGWAATMLVVFARQHDREFPKSECGVIHQPIQFSWTFDKRILARPIDQKMYTEVRRFVEAKLKNHTPASALKSLTEELGLPNHTLYYKKVKEQFTPSPRVQSFFSTLRPVKIIGTHEFFVDPKKDGHAKTKHVQNVAAKPNPISQVESIPKAKVRDDYVSRAGKDSKRDDLIALRQRKGIR